jgi:hypothetical protein
MRCTAGGSLTVTGGGAPTPSGVDFLQEMLSGLTNQGSLAWWTPIELDKLYCSVFLLKKAIWRERLKRWDSRLH